MRPEARSGVSEAYGADMDEQRRGLLLGVAAYAMWGLFPLYWPLLRPAGAVEVLAHRVAWSMVTMLVLTIVLGRTSHLRRIVRTPRTVVLLTIAAIVVAFNWGGFIYGVNAGRVVEVSLGYFINPLVTVLLGVLVLHERLRPLQWAGLALGAVAVVVLTVDYGHPPWIAFLLASSFGTYGLAKKKADVGAVESLTFETVVLFPVAIGWLLFLGATGRGGFTAHGPGHALLLVTTGLVTAIPLICFGAAATRVSMTTIGLLQYLAPTLQFVLGLAVFHETMTPVKWVGFALVWAALVVVTVETLHHHRSRLARAAEAVAA
ncbi:MAG: RarD protein superfamily transporter [Marmoricola sp.]|nr:RarD protein superfamily transporter [Marmoricola sp.]